MSVFHSLLFSEKTGVSLPCYSLSGLILSTSNFYSRSASILCSWCDYTPDSPSDLISPQFLVLEQVKSTVFRRDQTVNASEGNP